MKALIVEDDEVSRMLLRAILKHHGETAVAEDGREAVEAVRAALDSGAPFDLICLDIMMPEMDGQEALLEIRRLEEERSILPDEGARIIMVTALDDPGNIIEAFREQCDGYVVKPVSKARLLEKMKELGLIT